VAHGSDTRDRPALLASTTVDVSVVDVRGFIRAICAILRPPAREDALRRLYDNIDTLQSDVGLTNGFVGLLRRHALTAE